MAVRRTSPQRASVATRKSVSVRRRKAAQQRASVHVRMHSNDVTLRKDEKAAQEKWRTHPYRSFVEGLPAWLAILTLCMFTVVYLQSWTIAFLFTLVIAVMVALLFDVLHRLHAHLRIPKKQTMMYDVWLTRFGRGLLVTFSVIFLILFVLFSFTYQTSSSMPFMLGSVFTLVGIGLVFFLVVNYIALIIFLGFPRIRHQLSLATLLFFCYFYLFFAFAVRRVAV